MARPLKGKKKLQPGTCYNASYMRRTQTQKRFHNIGSGSWLAWANDIAVHCAAIHYSRQQTTGRGLKQAVVAYRLKQPH